MNAIKNLFSRFFTVTIADALADLDKAIVKLDKAEANHSKQVEAHTYIIEQATTAAARHEYAAVRAARVRSKLADLIG